MLWVLIIRGDSNEYPQHMARRFRYNIRFYGESRGDSNEYLQHMFLWRNKQNYPLIITKYPLYLFHWLMVVKAPKVSRHSCMLMDSLSTWASSWKNLFCLMRTTKVQISLRIRAVWSAPLLFTDISSFYIRNFKPLPSVWSWADRFESYLVANP